MIVFRCHCLALALLLLPALAVVAAAQEVSQESIFVDPANVASGQTDLVIDIYANDGEAFAQPAGKLPTIEVGSGLTLKNTQYISAKRIRITVDTAADAFGAPEVRVLTYSLDGTTVAKLATTALGVIGPATVTPLTVETPENTVVVPDLTSLQAAGNLIITGPLNGTVTVLAPAGVAFSTDDRTSSKVRALAPGTNVQPVQVAQDGSNLTFFVSNPTFTPVKLELYSISMSLQTFTAAGGQTGEVLFGVVLDGSQNSIGVSSSHTPGRTVTNPTDDQLEPPTNEAPTNETNNGGGTTTTGTEGDSGGATSNPTNSVANPNSNSNSNSNSNDGEATGDNPQQEGNRAAGLDNNQNPRVRGNRDNNRGRGNRGGGNRGGNRGGFVRGNRGGGGPAPSSGGSGSSGFRGGGGTPGFAGPGSVVGDPDSDSGSSVTTDIVGADPLIVVDSFTLCDEHFRPLAGVGFKPALDGSADFIATVRVQVVLSEDISPGRKGRLEVVIRVPGAEPMSAILTETDDDSGIYRSLATGVKVRLRPGD